MKKSNLFILLVFLLSSLIAGCGKSCIVYYVPNGKSYHLDRNCSTLARSEIIKSGSLEYVINLGKDDPCDICAGG
jgi:hypothetical protein